MNKNDLKTVLTNRYNRENWQDVIRDIFPNVTLFSEPFIIPVTKERLKDRISDFVQLGNVRLNDGKNIKIFELQLTDKINLIRNRVEMRNLIAEYIDMMDNHGVLAIFNSIDEDYRFTFTSKEAEITEAEGFVTKETDAKRYTYLLGPNEPCRTAVDQLFDFSNIKSSAKIEDVIKAFSVEKLSKLFFNEYKEQYEKFVCYITGKRFVKKGGKWTEKEIYEPHEYLATVFENDEKTTRDFIKKTLGRIVFLHFLQKKGWLGCPVNSDKWENGDKRFLHNYYENCSDKEHFYSKYLVPLFFDCLNKKRPNDVFEKTNSRIPYLNGGLFENKISLQDQLDIPADYWQNLFDFFAQFNFTIDENDPFEQEVGIDPEMLGHIFENLLEDNKDKGAFYTPKPIVEYMCKESLIQYLKTHLFPENLPNGQRPSERLENNYKPASERLKDISTLASKQLNDDSNRCDGLADSNRCDGLADSNRCDGLADSNRCDDLADSNRCDDLADSNRCDGFVNSTDRKVSSLENFIRNHDYGDPESSENYIKNNARQIEQLLDDVKICDPAIGSGAFPMGLLQEIFWAKMTLDWTLNPAETKKKIIENSIYGVDIDSGAIDIARLRFWLSLIVDAEKPEPLPNLDYKIMQGNSLLESFEGIDLSKVMEDKLTIETVIDGQQDLLDFANDNPQNQIIFSDDRKQKVQDLKDRYFSESDIETKKDIHKQIDEIVLEHIDFCLDRHKIVLQTQIAELENEIKKKEKSLRNAEQKRRLWLPNKRTKLINSLKFEKELINFKIEDFKLIQEMSDRPYFLWHLYFSEVFEEETCPEQGRKSGFDIVIGNPPYIQLQKDYGFLASMYEDQGFETFARTGDIYSLFYEQGYNILAENGHLCFITSNKWMRANYGKATRKFFADKTNPTRLIDFGGYKVFENATVDTNILIFKNSPLVEKCLTNSDEVFNSPLVEGCHEVTGCLACTIRKGFTRETDIAGYVKEKGIELSNLTEESWIISTKEEFTIKQKIEKIGTPLKDWDVSIYRGVLTGFNEAFIISGAKKDELIAKDPKSAEIIKPILRGRDIKRYKAEFADLWLIATHNGYKVNSPLLEGCDFSRGVFKKYKKLPYNPKLKERAKKLRKSGNLSEVLFWNQLKRKKFLSLDFHRQKIIGNYIVDFYCPALDLVVEIDGESHNFKIEYDKKRENYLINLDLKILHFQDIDIKKNLNGTMEYLEDYCKKILSDGGKGNTPTSFGSHPSNRGEFKIPRIDIEDYPAIKEHLNKYWDKISKRCDKGDTPYNLRSCAYFKEFEKEKIVYQEMVQKSSFVLDKTDNYFCLDTGRIITGKNIKYLLSLLNSKLFFFSVKSFYGGGALGKKGIRMKHTFFENFPIPKISKEAQKPFEIIVDQILQKKEQKATPRFSTKATPLQDNTPSLRDTGMKKNTPSLRDTGMKKNTPSLRDTGMKKNTPSLRDTPLQEGNDTKHLEDKIDLMVYKLYELTYEEVKIVDPGTALTKEEYEQDLS